MYSAHQSFPAGKLSCKRHIPIKVLLWILLGALFAMMSGTKVCSDAEGVEKHLYTLMACVSLLMVKSGKGFILPGGIFGNIQN